MLYRLVNIFGLVILCSVFSMPFVFGKTTNLYSEAVPYNWKNHPDIRRTGVQPDKPILIKSNGILFKVPAAYFKFWPKKNMAGRINQLDSTQKQTGGFNFIFWMPDKTPYPFKSWPARMVYHPSNDKIPTRFNVLVHNLRFQKADEYISPDKRLENVKGQAEWMRKNGKSEYVSEYFYERYGLIYYKKKSYHFVSDGYWRLPNTQPQVSFRCLSGNPSQICDGWVHYDDIDLAFYVRFKRRALPKWKGIVTAVRTLALEWRQKGTMKLK